MKALAIMLGALACTGCVEHRATAVVPTGYESARICVNGSAPQAIATTSIDGHLPQRLLIHGYHRGEDGRLTFFDADLRSPLSWWQRFPVDFLTHVCWPTTIRSQIEQPLTARPATTVDPAALEAVALAAGYAPVSLDQE